MENILYKLEDKIATITIDRPEKLNSLNRKTLEELKNVFNEMKDNEAVSVIILTGSGDKAFVAGADIEELTQLDGTTGKDFAQFGQSVFNLIENMEKPVIASVNGYALGGGCELALACHMRFASANAKFGQPEVKLGILPGYGGTQRLTRLVNTGRAIEYILSGDVISAEDASKIGLVNRVFKHEELLGKTKEFALKISSVSSQPVGRAIKSVFSVNKLTIEEGLKFESDMFAECCATEDFKEGTSAFLEKRAPHFTNR